MDNNSNTPLDNQQPVQPVNNPVEPIATPTEPQAIPVPTPSQHVSSEIQQPVAPAASAPSLDDLFDQIAEKIIEQQEAIIGPIAVEQAKSVKELKIDWANQHDVDIEGSPQIAIDELVEQYKELFGQIAVETCREAVAKLLSQVPADQQPSSLKS